MSNGFHCDGGQREASSQVCTLPSCWQWWPLVYCCTLLYYIAAWFGRSCNLVLWAAVWGVQHDFFPLPCQLGLQQTKGSSCAFWPIIATPLCHISAIVTGYSCNRHWPLRPSRLPWVGCTSTPSLLSRQTVYVVPVSVLLSLASSAHPYMPSFMCLIA